MTRRPETRSRSPLARAYVAAVTAGGVLCLGLAVRALLREEPSPSWLVLAALTWAAGWFAIKIPAIPVTIYVSETFVFALVLLFGTGPAVATVVIDGALISLRRRDRDIGRCLFNMAEPAVSVTAASAAFYLFSGIAPIALSGDAPPELPVLLLPAAGMALVYFLVNSWLTAVAVATETGIAPQDVLRKHLLGLGLNTLGGALLGLLLALQVPSAGLRNASQLTDAHVLSGLGVVVPLLLISYLTFRTSIARVEDANRHLKEMNRLYVSTVETLATAIDAKDQVTSHHIRRVQNYALGLARALGIEDDSELKAIEAAALLHDMGKLSVPEFILNKPGKLTPAEFERIKQHATVGAHILSQIDFPYPVVPIVRHHHECWDGTGYPDGIKGEAIPLGARIMAVVDCYDALTSHRPYRSALSRAEALEIIAAKRGSAYDPRVVDAFLGVVDDGSSLGGPVSEPLRAVRPAPMEPPETPAHGVESRVQPRTLARDPEGILLLCSLAEGLAGRARLDDVAEAMSRHLRRLIPAPLVVFYLPDPGTAEIVARHASGADEGRLEGLRIPMGKGLSGWVAAHRATIANSDPALDLGNRVASLSPRPESALSTPLLSGGELVGVLTLYAATREAFSEDHRTLVELAARQIAPAVARAACFDEQRSTQLRDGATGLPNGSSLERLLASGGLGETASTLSLGVLCFAMGSGGGDLSRETLMLQVAGATQQALRVTDMVFRYSDDELVILMPDTSPAATAQVAQRVAARLVGEVSAAADLPVEIGVAVAPGDGTSIDGLLAAARGRLERQRWRDLLQGLRGRAAADAGGSPE